MNRALLTFSAMLLASASMAQVGKVAPTLQVPSYKEAVTRMAAKPLASVSAAKAKSPVARAASNGLADNQHYMGPYYTDAYQADAEYGVGFEAGTFKVGVIVDYPQAVKFNGGKIVAIRYAVCDKITSPRVYVNTISNKDGNPAIGDEVVSQAGGTSSVGWNTVTLDNPYTINVDGTDIAAYMIGFEFTQAADIYPISVVSLNTNPALYVYGKAASATTEQWYNMGTTYGALSVQCIVEKDGGFHTVDAMLSDLRAPRYIQSGGKLSLGFNCASFSDDITSVQFGVKVNDTEVAELDYDSPITTEGSDLTVTVDTPDDLTIGKVGNLSLYVKKINGETPTDVNTMYDDEVSTSFVPYTNSFQRQKQLVEFFTSQAGAYCSYGDNVLAELDKLRDDIVKVGVHASLRSGTDEWALDESNALISFSTSSVPSASFNRYYCNSLYNSNDRIAIATDYNESFAATAAQLISNNVIDGSNYDYPAFATVNISTTYDENTRKLNIKVSGENVSDFKNVMGDDAVLNVYLTQDSQKGDQLIGSSTQYNYTNNDVLRMFVSGELGDAISWDGTSYEKNYEVTIPESISITKKKVMHVVAFISRPIKYSDNTFTTSITDAWVTNANSCKIGESTTGIKQGLIDVENVHEVARYSLDGMQLSAPVKGINIVKYSDGKTAKVVVK